MARLHITSTTELTIDFGDGRSFAVHPLWLRERCLDPKTVDPQTGQRLTDPSDLDLDLAVTAVSEPQSGCIRVRFSDGHEADFATRDILAEAALSPGEHDVPPVTLWNGSLTSLPRAQWVPHPSDAELAGWVTDFLEYGFLLLSRVPTAPRTILQVAAQFGFTRETNFGAIFEVRSVPAANDLAYTSLPLDPHTDNPYRTPVPGVQLLHCLTNETTGGLSTLVDGFAVAEVLRQREPEAFKLLASTPVRFRFRDAATEMVASAPLIELGAGGQIQAVHFSPRLDFVPLGPPQTLTSYYRARRAFDYLLRSPEFEIRLRLDSGELMIMDNRRLLHGRTGFDPGEGLRHLQGCYIDIDGPRSLYRVLRRRLAAGEIT